MKTTNKEAAAKNILGYSSLFVLFNTQCDGVVAPAYLKKKKHIMFQYGYDLIIPIPDLKIDNWGITGTLDFQGKSMYCAVPWKAVIKLEDEHGTHFSYAEEAARLHKVPGPPPLKLVKPEKKEGCRPQLRLIKGGKSG